MRIRVEGLSEFVQFAARVGDVAAPRRVRPILERGGEVIASGIRASISAFGLIRTGAMRDAIVTRLHRNENVAAGYVTIDSGKLRRGKSGKPVRYPFILATGAEPFSIRSGRIMADGEHVFGRQVSHPGFPRRDFFGSGFRASKDAAGALMTAQIAAELAEIKARHGA